MLETDRTFKSQLISLQRLSLLREQLNAAPRRLLTLASCGALAIVLTGCTSTSDATWVAAKRMLPQASEPLPQNLNPKFQYLRVQTGDRAAMLALGASDEHPMGRIDHWYSHEAEVLKLQNGRIVGTGGLTTNWVAVKIAATAAGYERVRDVMPGYRFGIKETITVRPLALPQGVLPAEIKVGALAKPDRAKALQWEEEISSDAPARPRGVIGYELGGTVGSKRAVIGYQCLDDGLCIQWERM